MSLVTHEATERRTNPRELDDVSPELAALLETWLLDVFWALARHTADRLGLLLAFTRITIRRESSWNVTEQRRRHERGDCSGHVTLTRSNCFGCDLETVPLYFHHIIEIQYGGSNAPRNQVPLCFACHKYLHPWLEAPSETETGLVPLRQIAENVNLVEQQPAKRAKR